MKNAKNKRGRTSSASVKVIFPIGVKLAIIIGGVVLISLGSVTFLSSYLMGQDVRITAENANLSVNEKAAGTVYDKFSSVRENVFQLLDFAGVVSGENGEEASMQAVSLFLKRNADIAVIYVLSADSVSNPNPSDSKIINRQFFARNEISETAADDFLYTRQDELARSCGGETIALNASPFFSMPACALLFPYRENGREQSCVIVFSIENLSDILGSGSVNTTFLINDSDELLFHPDIERTITGESFGNFPLVKTMRENNQNNDTSRQIPFVVREAAAENQFAAGILETKVMQAGSYIKHKTAAGAVFVLDRMDKIEKLSGNAAKIREFLFAGRGTAGENSGAADSADADGEIEKDTVYFGAYQKTNIADIVVLTTVSQDLVLEGVRKTLRNNIYLTLAIFFLSIILILFFARYGISVHLRRLTVAAVEIQQGNFGTEIIGMLNAKRHDEIGVLNESVKNEQEFLETFARFTNKGVAKAIARKEIDFDPHLKDVTVFFSDIRGFTSISDGFKNKFGNDSPREIIEFLNDYMGRMVECITLSGGTVDKFEGDAIMAVWGILRDEDLSFEQLPDFNPEKERRQALHEQHVKEDALNAIRGTIAMRYALMKYNKDAAAFTQAHKDDRKSAKYKPHIQIGCGLNTGRATAGILGGKDKMEYTAIGDAVNFASRTESSNKPCGTDILITEDTVAVLREEIDSGRIIVEQIPVAFEVKGKGTQHFYGVVNMPDFDIAAFFRAGDPAFVPDKDCMRACGKYGPRTLNEVRRLLGIPIPDFEKVNLNEEENKIQIKQ
ncbi:MAG: adenylate/guanylate cyclase domain-containing protein [Bacteroides sp.]|nr:adenylate/guanylate cyclase domain-containing protein [Prevotella sp.]MCM1408272.1 adenylate/guanylate cyclase domain-containing protein [Treponema brennaborense]MCM1470496.1 adenylate/guanylate cyclase domain-containing protein [Bacteroides sp.]